MPATTTKSLKKAAGAPKARGAVRAKSGCYTCRIRRKKCDEKQGSRGCQTCSRLQIECLGFGTKRPEWLRENSTVVALREKIKEFLSAQGMIKGCAGPGTRGETPEEQSFLTLSPGGVEAYASGSASPPHTMSISSVEDYYRPSSLHTSNMRNDTPTFRNVSGLRPASPIYQDVELSLDNDPYAASLIPTVNNSSQIMTWPSSEQSRSPAPISSTFSLLYHNIPDFSDDFETPSNDPLFMEVPAPFAVSSDPFEVLLQQYMRDVIGLQYTLADRQKILHIICGTLQTTGVSRDAAGLLASVHNSRKLAPTAHAMQVVETQSRYQSLCKLLNAKVHDNNDAMAALHVISTFLFDGGRGEWMKWLRLTWYYSDSVLRNTHFRDRRDAMLNCNEKERFVVQTTFWFDVLASVTTHRAPFFAEAIDEIFNPASSGLFDPTAPVPPELSMLSVMGCESVVLWALSKISTLAHWKREQTTQGKLSMPGLVARASEIETLLSSTTQLQSTYYESTDDIRRNITARIFRACAYLYLRSVVSGDHPLVAEVRDSVEDIMDIYRNLRSQTGLSTISSIVRTTVFPIFICGALTFNPKHQEVLSNLLAQEQGPGNCQSVLSLLHKIWSFRTSRGTPVPWRDTLHNEGMLLV